MKYLTIEQLDSLREIDTPTVANAVETHENRLNTEAVSYTHLTLPTKA